MYRDNDRAKHAPTIVEYESKRVRVGYLFLAVLMLLFGAGVIASMHLTHITCSRSNEGESGMCRIRRYGLLGSLDEELFASEIASFDVQVRTGSKGSKYAEVRLLMTPESHRNTIVLEKGSWSHVDPDHAFEARAELLAFQRGAKSSADIWLDISLSKMAFMLLFGGGIFAFGLASLREQLVQLRPIRVVVIPEREVVVVRGQEIPWKEIEDVRVAYGRALFWASGKNEHVPGCRLVFIRRSGNDIPATKDYRAGDVNRHERARKQILRALGRDRD